MESLLTMLPLNLLLDPVVLVLAVVATALLASGLAARLVDAAHDRLAVRSHRVVGPAAGRDPDAL